MIDWIVENKEWLFSGIGVALIALILPTYKLLRKFSRNKIKFCIPATLCTFTINHDSTKTHHTSKVRRITTIRSLVNGKISVKYPSFTLGKFKNAISLSHPDTMNITSSGDNEKENRLDIVAQKNKHYIIVSESIRTRDVNAIPNKPSMHDKILWTLFEKRLLTKHHVFVGTRIYAPTDWVKLVIEFEDGEKPNALYPIQIDSNGEIIKDENCKEFNIVFRRDKTLYILELENPMVDSGIYVWWKWENSGVG